jgi:hypothetical protein
MKKHLSLLFMLVAVVSISAQDYAGLLDKVVKFYGYQRAGLKSGTSGNLNNMNQHGGDNLDGHQLDGGWYDAGDYIKFGMPFGYSVYSLLKGYDVFPSQYTDNYKADNSAGADNIPDILNQCKYATDYLIKAVIDDKTIVRDVGQGQAEHDAPWSSVPNSGGRSGGMIYKCTGADIPAMYSACLALMSVLYKKYDAAYASQCSTKAVVAFKFARGKIEAGGVNNLYCDYQTDNSGNAFYYYYKPKDGEMQRQIADKMVAAGVELYRATGGVGDPIYKTWAQKPITENYNVMCYSFIGPLASFEAWRQGLAAPASLSHNVGFVANNIKTTGFFSGVYQNAGWGTARDISTAAFDFTLAYIATSAQAQRDSLLNRIKNHVNWVMGTFGQTKRCYIVGLSGGPTSVHYRPNSAGPQGGVVSGPDDAGGWANDGSAKYTEVALDYNAGIAGALAFLKALANPGSDIKMNGYFTATPSANVDFTSGSVKLEASFSKSVACTIKIVGGTGTKMLAQTGTSISQTWDGSADKGFFLSGESVTAQLHIDGNIIAYDMEKASPLSISIVKAKKIATTPSDVLVDNFEDGDTVSKINGKWRPIGSDMTSFAGKTILNFDTMNATKCVKVKCNVASDAPTTFAGIKATFNANETPTAIGDAKSIVFDMRGDKPGYVRVELAQSTITDSAFYGIKIPITTLPNTYRVNISDFSQPDWKTSDKSLDRNSITALRFVVYDSTGVIQLFLDNVYIESLNSATVTNVTSQMRSTLMPVVAGGALRYRMAPNANLPVDLTICDIVGRVVMKRTIKAGPGEVVSVSLSELPAGIFTVEHSIGGARMDRKMKITHVR